MKRGEIVLGALPGDYGKVRPLLVVQTDLANETHPSVVVCPITTELVDAPYCRIRLTPQAGNGLKAPSDIMIDKVGALKRSRLKRAIGRINDKEQSHVDEALRVWLMLG